MTGAMNEPLLAVLGAASLMAGALFGSVACREPTEAGRAARLKSTCERYCRLVVRSPEASPAGDCHRGCLAHLRAEADQCSMRLARWMDCEVWRLEAEESQIPKPPLPAYLPARCPKEHSAFVACARDCQKDGVLESGEIRLNESEPPRAALYEVWHHGCTPCGALPGAGTNAPCSSAKVCAAHCVACGSGREALSLRACVDHHCAAASELESLQRALPSLLVCTDKPPD
jgi:hypothetical protein